MPSQILGALPATVDQDDFGDLLLDECPYDGPRCTAGTKQHNALILHGPRRCRSFKIR